MLLNDIVDVVGFDHCLTDPDLRASYEVDWTGRYRGTAPAVVRPGSTVELAAVLALCHDAGQPVVSAAREGRLEMHYLVSGESEPRVLVWRPPLTSVLGPMTCPKGGEPLEANWKFCPWHGVPLGDAAGSKASR